VTQATVPGPHEFTPHSPRSETAGGEASAPDNLALFAAGFFEGVGPALTTVLSRNVPVQFVDVRTTAPAELAGRLPLPWILIEVTYQRGLRGTHWLVLSHAHGLALAQALAGAEDDPAEEMLPAHQEAIRDAINQILAASGPTLMPLVARSVVFAPVTVHLVEDRDVLPPELGPQAEPLWLARGAARLAEGREIELLLTIVPALAREIQALGNEDQARAPAADARRGEAPSPKMDMLLDVTLPVKVELGRARMQIQDILKLGPGSVIELDKSAGDPVELFINDRPIARGEVVIIDENFGIRLTSIVATTERLKTLR
jgi:flagellar motor switch protein FliN